MFREMRRQRQQLSDAETIGMLESSSAGVLALQGDGGYPYAVPISFAYEDGKLFFHSAVSGQKIDAIERSDKASFCVIDTDEVIQSTFTTHFRSAVVFGRVRVLADGSEKRHALRLLAEKYSPDYVDAADGEIERSIERVAVIELAIEHMTGKAAIELINEAATE